MSTGPRPAPNVVAGAALMTASALAFAASHSLVRVIAEELHVFEIVLLRFAVGTAIVAPLALRRGGASLQSGRQAMHFLAGFLNATITILFFFALALLPLAEVTALSFTVPLFTTLLAALLLRERVDAGRWAATLVGFAGVLVIVRPGFAETTALALLPIGGALQLALVLLITRSLTRTEPPLRIVFYQTVWPMVLMGVLSIFVWRDPSLRALAIAVAMGVLGTIGIATMTRAMAVADASVVAPLDYTRLPFIAVIGYVAFGELPDAPTWLGSAIIVAAAIYIARRERRLERAATVAPDRA